jgi:hypothetical protein
MMLGCVRIVSHFLFLLAATDVSVYACTLLDGRWRWDVATHAGAGIIKYKKKKLPVNKKKKPFILLYI